VYTGDFLIDRFLPGRCRCGFSSLDMDPPLKRSFRGMKSTPSNTILIPHTAMVSTISELPSIRTCGVAQIRAHPMNMGRSFARRSTTSPSIPVLFPMNCWPNCPLMIAREVLDSAWMQVDRGKDWRFASYQLGSEGHVRVRSPRTVSIPSWRSDR
jgi:hypothetical protein